MPEPFVDIHCHVLPGIDDGAKDWTESLSMARLAAEDGTTTIIATPHQLGAFGGNDGESIRCLVGELNERLRADGIPITVLPGAEVRIEPGLAEKLTSGEVVSLGDHRRHVLLELPRELYFSIDSVLDELAARRVTVILAHPERNAGLLRAPELVGRLVDAGCLMQITGGSLFGILGAEVQAFSEWMVAEGLVHIVASDAHSPRSRRPLIGRAYERVCQLMDEQTAQDLCCRFPARVAAGRTVTTGRRRARPRRRTGWFVGRVA
jgi:protein-tyrosine phosphatase